MIHAIRNNKAGRNFRDATDWHSLFGGSEDSLTSSVFGHLFYLPPVLLWPLLLSATPSLSGLGADQCPAIESFEFWPRWIADGTRNVSYVEPDIFLRTSSFDLLIEAKRFDYDQQDREQWQDQLRAYHNVYGQDRKRVALLAVGGISRGAEQPVPIAIEVGENGVHEYNVYACRWLNLLASTQEKLVAMQALGAATGQQHVTYVLNDIVDSFGLHGYATRALFDTLPQPLRPLHRGRGLQLFLRAATGHAVP